MGGARLQPLGRRHRLPQAGHRATLERLATGLGALVNTIEFIYSIHCER